MLTLTRPLVFLDFETDGPSEPDPAQDRIIQAGLFRLEVDGTGTPRTKLIHPGPECIPLKRSEIHGITDQMLVAAPRFEKVAKSFLAQIDGCDIATFNGSNYDIPLLWEELWRAGITWDTSQHRLVDVAALWRKMEPRSLSDAVRRFCGVEPSEDMHDAGVDARCTRDVLAGMMERWPEAPRSIDDLARLTAPALRIGGKEFPRIDLAGILVRDENGRALYAHKKNRGMALEDDRGYADWLLRQAWISAETRTVLERELRALTPVLDDPPSAWGKG